MPHSTRYDKLWFRHHICYVDMSLRRNMSPCDKLWLRHNLKVSLHRNMPHHRVRQIVARQYVTFPRKNSFPKIRVVNFDHSSLR